MSIGLERHAHRKERIGAIAVEPAKRGRGPVGAPGFHLLGHTSARAGLRAVHQQRRMARADAARHGIEHRRRDPLQPGGLAQVADQQRQAVPQLDELPLEAFSPPSG